MFAGAGGLGLDKKLQGAGLESSLQSPASAPASNIQVPVSIPDGFQLAEKLNNFILIKTFDFCIF